MGDIIDFRKKKEEKEEEKKKEKNAKLTRILINHAKRLWPENEENQDDPPPKAS